MEKNYLARYFAALPGDLVRCTLCPHKCLIQPGKTGICQARMNRDGQLYSLVYGRPAALQVDAIEKKPLAFWKIGSKTFSIGTCGCNLSCRFCQNDSLSRSGSERNNEYLFMEAEKIIELALEQGCESVAFTYNEPTIFLEYAVDIAKAAKAAGLGTVLVSNGWINPEPRQELYQWIDAANIDIKGFSERFYKDFCGASLAEVLESCKHLRFVSHSHLEVTNLVIPGCNDEDADILALLDWIGKELGFDTPVHFSAYFPAGGFTAPATPAETLYHIRDLALKRGFTRIKLGNLH